MKIAPGDDPAAAVEPTKETIESGKYAPLSRPVFIYVNRKSLARKEVAAFARFYLSDAGQKLVSAAHCISLNPQQLEIERKKLEDALKANGS